MSNTVVNTFEPTCTSTSAQIKTFLILLDLLRLVLRDYFWTSLYSVLRGLLLDLPLPVPWWLLLKPPSTPFSGEHFWTYLYLPQSFRAGCGGCCCSGGGPQEYILLLLVLVARQKHLFLSVEQSHYIPLQNENNFTQYSSSFFIHVLVLNWSYALWLKFKRSKYISFLISLCKSDIGWILFQSVQKNLKSLLLSEHPPCFLCSPEIRSSSSR